VLPSLSPHEAKHAREMADTGAGRVRLATDIREALFKADGVRPTDSRSEGHPSIEVAIVSDLRGLEKTVL